jgi:hypothetical protein
MVPTSIAERPKLLSTTLADSSSVMVHSGLVIKSQAFFAQDFIAAIEQEERNQAQNN